MPRPRGGRLRLLTIVAWFCLWSAGTSGRVLDRLRRLLGNQVLFLAIRAIDSLARGIIGQCNRRIAK